MKTMNKNQVKDSGMAFVLILLIIGLFTGNKLFFVLSAAFLLADMIFPMIFYPFALIWLGFSEVLGKITSKIMLFIIYLAVVLPVALVRRLTGKDALSLRRFKKGNESVLISRNHLFKPEDLERPF